MIKDIKKYLDELRNISNLINCGDLESFLHHITKLKNTNRRLFIVGVGGSAANASHAVNDFRKILGIETYSPLDNVAELTARINDDGWDTSLSSWLRTSKINKGDCLLVFSVGGGSEHTSQNLVKAMKLAKDKEATVLSVVSRSGGIAKEVSDCCVMIPVVNETTITPHAEEWQGIVWHMAMAILGEK